MNKRLGFSSPIHAAAAGVAVCLSAGTAQGVSGNVAASNGATVFAAVPSANAPFKLFGSLANLKVEIYNSVTPYLSNATALPAIASAGGYVNHVGAGVNVSPMGFYGFVKMRASQANNYIGVHFSTAPVKFGWVHCVSTSSNGRQLQIDTWSYNASGGGIKTLGESISAKQIALTDGRAKLSWSNANEAGVARYEVQAKGADGAWAAMDSSTPGDGSYCATFKAGAYRLLVENSDGSAREIAF